MKTLACISIPQNPSGQLLLEYVELEDGFRQFRASQDGHSVWFTDKDIYTMRSAALAFCQAYDED